MYIAQLLNVGLMTNIDPRLVARALEEVDTYNFERFGQTFYGAMQDREFVPLGGMHDGGAEGFDGELGVYETQWRESV